MMTVRQLNAILFCSLVAFNVYASQKIDSVQDSNAICNTTQIDRFIEAKHATALDITVKKSRKWAKNYFRAVKSDYRHDGKQFIPRKFKKKFNADIMVSFDNGLICHFPAKIRISGDWKDHISSAPLITSLDVKLLRGNINAITKFKLFLPHTRNGDNEIFVTALLHELKFLSPKTYYLPTVFNDQPVQFIFQEKATKTLIESNHFREAPILEGDETFIWIHDTDADTNRSEQARIVNEKWAQQGPISLGIAHESLGHLNEIYLKPMQPGTLRPLLRADFLGNNNEFAIKKNQAFSAFLFALCSAHGLLLNNRKFYYEPIHKYFLPIYYDGNSKILHSFIKQPDKYFSAGRNEVIGAKYALDSLQTLNQKKLLAQLKQSGIDINARKLSHVIDKITKNLQVLAKIPYEETDKSDTYKRASNDTNQQKQPDQTITTTQLENESILTTYGLMKTILDRNNKTLFLYQTNVNDRALIAGGTLKNWTINLHGTDKGTVHNEQRFNENLLTGCLTLLDIQVDEMNITANNALCEDSVNFIRAHGTINNIVIQNAMSDALDIDFSNLNINRISIENAGNDCLDLSAGKYQVAHSVLRKCQDKAISVGEKTVSFFDNIDISNSNVGVAAKDSSIVDINIATLENTELCFSAYNKKQEFWGGKITIQQHNCSPDKIYQQQNSLIVTTP